MSVMSILFPGQGAFEPAPALAMLRDVPWLRKGFAEGGDILGVDLEREIETAMSTGGTSVFLQHCGTFLWSLLLFEKLGLRNCDTVRLAGHSLGQFAAYAASGAIDRDAAIALVAQRGRVLEDACREHPGMMVAVQGGSLAEVGRLCEQCASLGPVVVANVNDSHQIVVSGKADAVIEVRRLARASSWRSTVLNTAGAFHSPLMRDAADRFAGVLAHLGVTAPKRPLLDANTGEYLTTSEAVERSAFAHMLAPVRWDRISDVMVASDDCVVLELGPGRVLTGLARARNRQALVLSTHNPAALPTVRSHLAPYLDETSV